MQMPKFFHDNDNDDNNPMLDRSLYFTWLNGKVRYQFGGQYSQHAWSTISKRYIAGAAYINAEYDQ